MENINIPIPYTMRQAAKLIGFPHLGRNKLYTFLREKGIILNKYEPAQKYIDLGYFTYEGRFVENGYGSVIGHTPVTYVTENGIEFLKRLVKDHIAAGGLFYVKSPAPVIIQFFKDNPPV